MLDIPRARALLTRTRPAHPSAGYPVAVRDEVVALTQHLLAQGRTTHSVARDLGLHGSTLRGWLEAAAVAGSAFVPVMVEEAVSVDRSAQATAPCPAQVPPAGRPAGLTLVSPRGFRLEGLDLDSALIALQRLS